MKTIAHKIHEGLVNVYSDGEIKAFTRIIATELLGVSQMAFYLKDDITLTTEQEALLGNAIERLQKREPIQHILGYSDFCGLRFNVKRGKPFPDPYLLAMEKGGFAANEVFVVENASLGVTAGVAAGLFTVAANTGPLNPEVLSNAGASHVFPSIEALCNEWDKLYDSF